MSQDIQKAHIGLQSCIGPSLWSLYPALTRLIIGTLETIEAAMAIALGGFDSSHGLLHGLLLDIFIHETIPIGLLRCILLLEEYNSWLYCYWWVDFFIHVILDANIFKPFMSQDSVYTANKA